MSLEKREKQALRSTKLFNFSRHPLAVIVTRSSKTAPSTGVTWKKSMESSLRIPELTDPLIRLVQKLGVCKISFKLGGGL